VLDIAVQLLLRQSESTKQATPSAQPMQLPPQSISISSPSFTPFPHASAATATGAGVGVTLDTQE
jgi:hypothetical protein